MGSVEVGVEPDALRMTEAAFERYGVDAGNTSVQLAESPEVNAEDFATPDVLPPVSPEASMRHLPTLAEAGERVSRGLGWSTATNMQEAPVDPVPTLAEAGLMGTRGLSWAVSERAREACENPTVTRRPRIRE